MQVELLTVGSELLSGATLNTNAVELARRLAGLGLPCRRQLAVSDDPVHLREALQEALGRARLLVITGGLGPTFDDRTVDAIAAVTGRPLVWRPDIARRVRRFYSRRRRRLQQAALRQARVPRGAEPLPNPIGTAPGIWLPLPSAILVALPGVPAEMRAMWDRSVAPRLRRLPGRQLAITRTLRTAGMVELSIEAVLRRLRLPRTVDIGLYPNLRMVDVRITATRGASRTVAHVEAALRRGLGAAVYGTGDETLEGVIGALLLRRRATVAVAESCTGGGVADRLTNVPGSSRYFVGGVIAYANRLKLQPLGVTERTLQRWGAVSAPTARRMAEGIRRVAAADVSVAITGIAGPSGGTARKPVGLVYVAVADWRGAAVQRHRFFGDRAAIKAQAAQAALDALRLRLIGDSHRL